MERVPVLKIGEILLVSIQVDMEDQTALQLQEDLADRIVATGASGVIILLDATASDLRADIATYLQPLARHGSQLPVVVGLSKADIADLPDLDGVNEHAAACLRPLPLVPFDARNADEVLMLMDVLMGEVEAIGIAG